MLDNSDLASLSSLDGDGEPDLMMAMEEEDDDDDRCPSPSSSVSSLKIRMKMNGRADCQLSWTEHQSHLTEYFDSLFRRERMVDVTLVCPDLSIRAHRVVLSACSSFLGGMLAENPSSHPFVLLPDVAGWQLEALVRFMYRGEIAGVTREDLPSLIRVAETLQVRGLTTLESTTNGDSRCQKPAEQRDVPAAGSLSLKRDLFDRPPTDLPIGNGGEDEQPMAKLPRIQPNGFVFEHTSPLPRRKQARPRRRSGDSVTTPPSSATTVVDPSFKSLMSTPSPVQDIPEDLSVKKSPPLELMRTEDLLDTSVVSREDTPLPELDHHHNHASTSKADSLSVHSDSGKSEFSLAERNGLFSPNLCGPLVSSMSGSTPPTPTSLFSSMPPMHQSDRRKGQHSAPRGGPPRAWTNGDLTEALNHVWNRKMTTSQASRVFGIPYNSLLMYVRGKYGKSLKLDTLRKETLEGEAMALAASTRGSYKLAAAAAAAAAATNGGGGSATSTSSTTPATNTKTTSTASKTKASSMNHNNNNNNEPKSSNKFGTPHLGEMEALSSMAGLAAAGLAAGGFGPNPYLSYFCDFTFPGHHLGSGTHPHLPVASALLNNKHHRPNVEKKIDLRPAGSHNKGRKESPGLEEEGASPPPSLRLGVTSARSLLPMDLPQTGQV